jgi:hypothetical protein
MGAVTAAIIVGAGAVVGGVAAYAGAQQQSKAAKAAAEMQAQYGQKAMDAETARFLEMKAMLQPYADAGTQSLSAQQDLLGQNGAANQQRAIDAIQNGAYFQSIAKQGENGILQNASATGGLRGGNVQAALSQFRPALLQSLINDQYGKLQGITQLGQAAASGQASGAIQTGSQTAALLNSIGNAQAQGIVGSSAANAAGFNSLGGAFQGGANNIAGLNALNYMRGGGFQGQGEQGQFG